MDIGEKVEYVGKQSKFVCKYGGEDMRILYQQAEMWQSVGGLKSEEV